MERASTAQLTNGPRARVGRIMEVDLPRPRSREMLLEHPKYYDLRENLIAFLAEYDGQCPVKSEAGLQDAYIRNGSRRRTLLCVLT